MAQQSKYQRSIPAFYKRTAIHLSMYGFVVGTQSTLHTISIKDAINMFLDAFNISPDEMNVDSLAVVYDRMQNEYKETQK